MGERIKSSKATEAMFSEMPRIHIQTYYAVQEHIENSADDLHFDLKTK